VRSCLIDGEAVFERLRREPSGKHVFRYRLLPPAEAGPKPIL